MPFYVFADLLLLAGGRSLRLCLVDLLLCPLLSLFTDPAHSLLLAVGGELKQLWDSPRRWK